jgi:CheY-like chemotaxis protein/curved DNA-binding protein CbpA
VSRILILDDDPRFAGSLTSLLEGLGYTVDQALSTEEAIEFCATPPDLLICDLVLPGDPPGVAVDALRAVNPDLAVILVSGFFSDGDPVQQMRRRTRADVFLHKPFDFDVLVEVLRQQLGAPATLSEGAQEPELPADGRLDEVSLATVLMRASDSLGAIVNVRNQRGSFRFFVAQRKLCFWQSDRPGENLAGLIGLDARRLVLPLRLAATNHLSLLDALTAYGLTSEGRAIAAWKQAARGVFERSLLLPGYARVIESVDFIDVLPDIGLDLDTLLLEGIKASKPAHVRHFLQARVNGLLLPGDRALELAGLHQRVFPDGFRRLLPKTGKLTDELLGRLWSDPRRRDRVMAEFYALLVTEQVTLLSRVGDAADEAGGGMGVMREAVHDLESLEGVDEASRSLREDLRLRCDGLDLRSHYDVLEVSESAEREVILAAFRTLFTRFHTDRLRDIELGSDVELVQRLLARAGAARDVLVDDQLRAEYDLRLERLAAGASVDVDELLAADGQVRKLQRMFTNGAYRQAVGAAAELLSLRPNAAQYQFYHRFALAMSGDANSGEAYEALADLAQSATVPGGERMLGLLAIRGGDHRLGKKHLKSALSEDSKDHVAERALRRIEANG